MMLSNKIQQLRKKQGLSQEALADELNVSRQAVSKWENDQGYPETDKLIQMSHLFNVSIDYLLKEETESTEDENLGYYVNEQILNQYIHQKKASYLSIAIGVTMIIMSLVFPLNLSEDLGVVFFLMIAAMGVMIIVGGQFMFKADPNIEQQELYIDVNLRRSINVRASKAKRLSGVGITLGIGLLIFSVVLLYVAFELYPGNIVYGSLAFTMAALGVSFVIIFGSQYNLWNPFSNPKEYRKEKELEKKESDVFGILIPIALVIYLITGFVWQLWAVTWFVFPIAAVLGVAIARIKKD